MQRERVTDQSSPTRGLWLRRRCSDIAPDGDWNSRVVDAICDAVLSLKGDASAVYVRRNGVARLHEVIEARDVAALRDRVLDRLRVDLLRIGVCIGRRLGWTNEFYVDDYLILRINFPFELARNADPSAENPGIGRVSASVRQLAADRRIKDPVYDPKAYHRGFPPAAWAHGPHRDSWAGHSCDGINVWWAISDVPAEAGMVLYDGLMDVDLPCDRRSLYLRAGVPLPAPVSLSLSAGEMLIFDPEVLHGTHLNVTNTTRVAVSLRLNASKPRFDAGCFYAREFWRRATDIEGGQMETVLHLKREDNLLSEMSRPPRAPRSRPKSAGVMLQNDDAVLQPSTTVDEGERIFLSSCP